MLLPRHPQPVARRREVAAAVVSQKQRAPIEVGHVFVVAGEPPAPPPPPVADVPDKPG